MNPINYLFEYSKLQKLFRDIETSQYLTPVLNIFLNIPTYSHLFIDIEGTILLYMENQDIETSQYL